MSDEQKDEQKKDEGQQDTGSTTGSSPLPPEEEKAEVAAMNFFDALREVQRGKRVTRREWADEKVYGFLEGGVLKLHQTDGSLNTWIISDGDMGGEDWFVTQ